MYFDNIFCLKFGCIGKSLANALKKRQENVQYNRALITDSEQVLNRVFKQNGQNERFRQKDLQLTVQCTYTSQPYS
jgi:hypothetical protein